MSFIVLFLVKAPVVLLPVLLLLCGPEELGLMYCAIHKVASTKLKEWFVYAKARKEQGLPWEPLLGDSEGQGGARNNLNLSIAKGVDLDGLGHAFDEGEALRQATRRDLFKFAFVRNPFSRLLSAYQDKHVVGGEQRSRRYWNQVSRKRITECESTVQGQIALYQGRYCCSRTAIAVLGQTGKAVAGQVADAPCILPLSSLFFCSALLPALHQPPQRASPLEEPGVHPGDAACDEKGRRLQGTLERGAGHRASSDGLSAVPGPTGVHP